MVSFPLVKTDYDFSERTHVVIRTKYTVIGTNFMNKFTRDGMRNFMNKSTRDGISTSLLLHFDECLTTLLATVNNVDRATLFWPGFINTCLCVCWFVVVFVQFHRVIFVV